MTIKLNAAIVEDMPENVQALHTDLQLIAPEITVTHIFPDLNSFQKSFQETSYDLVFLDVDLPDGNSFDLLPVLEKENHPLHIIFTTAHPKYATQAFRVNAVDYLVKPIDRTELKKSLLRVSERVLRTPHPFPEQERWMEKPEARLAISSQGGLEFLDADEIIRLEAAGNYTIFHMRDGSQIVSTRLLKSYEGKLRLHRFMRVHSSHVINLKHVIFVGRADGGYVTMLNRKRIPIGRKYKNTFFNAVKYMGHYTD